MENTDLPEIKLRMSKTVIQRKARKHADQCLEWISWGGYDGTPCENMKECASVKFSRNKKFVDECVHQVWDDENMLLPNASCEDKLVRSMECHLQKM